MFKVVYSARAAKELQKLDRNTAAFIYSWIDKNLVDCSNPRQYGRALTGAGSGYWRYRVGSYRLVAQIVDNEIQIAIIAIANRREVYRTN